MIKTFLQKREDEERKGDERQTKRKMQKRGREVARQSGNGQGRREEPEIARFVICLLGHRPWNTKAAPLNCGLGWPLEFDVGLTYL